jgi:hypothetical protein
MYPREEFRRQLDSAKAREAADRRWLAAFSVGLGLGQLVFLRVAERTWPHRQAIAIAGVVFLLYLAGVIWLLFRLQLRKRAYAPRCPACGAILEGVSARIAVASSHCDSCGAQVLE